MQRGLISCREYRENASMVTSGHCTAPGEKVRGKKSHKFGQIRNGPGELGDHKGEEDRFRANPFLSGGYLS